MIGEPATEGRVVTGRLRLGERLPVGEWYNWQENLTDRRLTRSQPLPEPPATLAGEDRRLKWFRWIESEAGQEYLRHRRNYTVDVAPEGTFRTAGVLSGTYEFHFAAVPVPLSWREPLAQRAAAWQGRATQTVVVPNADPMAPEATVDLGEVELTIRGPRAMKIAPLAGGAESWSGRGRTDRSRGLQRRQRFSGSAAG